MSENSCLGLVLDAEKLFDRTVIGSKAQSETIFLSKAVAPKYRLN
jgi:hypothetical protein